MSASVALAYVSPASPPNAPPVVVLDLRVSTAWRATCRGSAHPPARAVAGQHLVFGAAGLVHVGDVVQNILHVRSNGVCAYNSGACIGNLTVSGTVPAFVPGFGDSDTGVGTAGSNLLSLTAGGAETLRVSATTARLAGLLVNAPHAATCTDSGDGNPGALTLTPASSRVHVTNSDADGCDVTMGETGMTSGLTVEIVVVSNAGGTVDFADSSGVLETPSGGVALALYDALTAGYLSDRFVVLSTSDN